MPDRNVEDDKTVVHGKIQRAPSNSEPPLSQFAEGSRAQIPEPTLVRFTRARRAFEDAEVLETGQVDADLLGIATRFQPARGQRERPQVSSDGS